MPKVGKKKFIDVDVYNASLNRIRYCYKNFDEIVVSFSGGKDSTVVLGLTLQVAKELNKLPVKVVFYDGEVVEYETADYVRRVRNLKEVNLDWYALEFKHRNASSRDDVYWYSWDKDQKEKWCRDLEDFYITEHPLFKKGMSFQEFSKVSETKVGIKVVIFQGLRAEESFQRYRGVSFKRVDNYITLDKYLYFASPIYDWSSLDVWKLVYDMNLDYNKTYDLMNLTDSLHGKLLNQRVCPPFGEEPLRSLSIYKEAFPELWDKMQLRVKGANTASIYGKTFLYGNKKIMKPKNWTWREYIQEIVNNYPVYYRNMIMTNVNNYIIKFKKRNGKNVAIPEKIDGSLNFNISWEFLTKLVLRGDFKNRVGGKQLFKTK